MHRLLPLILFAWATFVRADLPPPVAAALKAAQIPATSVAVVVQPVDARTPLVAHNAQQAMNPASTMKLVTTYAALDLLGPAWTWKTVALADSAPVDGVLNGNLYLRGSGDPRFAIQDLWALLRQLRVRSVQRIAGDVVLDRAVFDVPAIDPGAFDDKPMRPYNVGPNGLLINFQSLRFTLVPGAGRPQVLMETPDAALRVDNRLQAGEGPCGSDWKDRIAIRLIPDANGGRLEFAGSYSPQCGEKALNLAPLPADAHAGGLIRALWQELGGTLAGQVRAGTTPASARPLAENESAPLADIVRDINKWSNNVMARQVFLTLGNESGPATAERARRRIAAWLDGRGLRFPELVLDNGSGLSREERIAAASMNRLLLDAWRHPAMAEFISSMPIVGIDGTMKRRLKDSQATGRAHIKTGYLDGVRAAAGYALDADGRRIAVTAFINHPRAAAGGPAIDALIAWVAQRRAGETPPPLSDE
ncbi:MAG: D-alanyl-D-alanine carboxypeptidase/D-alanyl-D-alanine-endopeptidase [Betaproteobacteria bacterium]|nr:D-alanyl-D-alanine carboxypeptidase/D-alanyl-D-alanine-endopeptidase [Betaproteobacteria bacterium]